MNSRARLWRRGGLVLLVAGLGCHRAPADASPPSPPPAASSEAPAAATPVDQLAPGELIEGTEEAMGVKLPRDLHLEQAFVDVAYARGFAPVHALVQYFRARLRDGSLREGDMSATFEHVHVPARPGREMSVHVVATIAGMRVTFRDTTPAQSPNLPTDEARLRAVGLSSNGRWLDPTHLN